MNLLCDIINPAQRSKFTDDPPKRRKGINMRYKNIKTGIFKERPNRFIAMVEIDGVVEVCHVKNTGRCKELLMPDVTVYVEESDNPNRKTKYSLIGVQKGERLINMDSQAPNQVVYEWLKGGGLFSDIVTLKKEKTYGSSRFDLYVERSNSKAFIEVKGVTLEDNGVVRFPDAPTVRGVKHIHELIECKKDGYEAYIIFVIQMKGVAYFEPNDTTHREFGIALQEAKRQGVSILAYDCEITPDEITLQEEVEIRIE